jgi:hypothetical protein
MNSVVVLAVSVAQCPSLISSDTAASSSSSSTASWCPKPRADLLARACCVSSGANDRKVSHVDPALQTTGSTIGGGGLSSGVGRAPLIPPSPAAALFTSGRVSAGVERERTALCASHSATGMANSSGPDRPRLWQRRRRSPTPSPSPLRPMRKPLAAESARKSETGRSNSKRARSWDILILVDDWHSFSNGASDMLAPCCCWHT